MYQKQRQTVQKAKLSVKDGQPRKQRPNERLKIWKFIAFFRNALLHFVCTSSLVLLLYDAALFFFYFNQMLFSRLLYFHLFLIIITALPFRLGVYGKSVIG